VDLNSSALARCRYDRYWSIGLSSSPFHHSVIQTVVGRVERASVQGNGSFVPQHDQSQAWSPQWRCKFLFSIFGLFVNFNPIGSLPPFISTGWWASTDNEQKWEADRPSPIIPRFSHRPQHAKPRSPHAPKHLLQEDDHQTVKNYSIDSYRHSAQAFKVNFQFSLSYRFHPILTLSFQGASAMTGTSSVTLLCTRLLFFSKSQQYLSASIPNS